MCLKDNIYTYNNLQVHHIVSIEKDNDRKLDSDNLITLCSYHHKQAEMNKITEEELYRLIKKQ
jgi:5-methylcytosine-specific restriction endonuclease McrA